MGVDIEISPKRVTPKEWIQGHLTHGLLRIVDQHTPSAIFIAEHLNFLQLDSKSLENLKSTREYLTTHPQKNLCLVFNHVSLVDPVLVLRIFKQYLDPARDREAFIYVSHYHSDPDNDRFFASMVQKSQEFLGGKVNSMRVIQSYMLQKHEREKWGYTPEKVHAALEQQKLDKEAMLAAAEKGHITVVVSPEGTRSPKGELQKPARLVEYSINDIPDTVVLPFGLDFRHYPPSRNLNALRKVNVRVGDLLFPDQNHFNIETIMQAISSQLPIPMRGVYAG